VLISWRYRLDAARDFFASNSPQSFQGPVYSSFLRFQLLNNVAKTVHVRDSPIRGDTEKIISRVECCEIYCF
jgi:hypothetical protein